MTNWIEVKALFDTPPQDWSPFVDAFDRHGCPGTLQTDTPATISGYLVQVAGSDERAKALQEELVRLGALSTSSVIVPEENWAELWKQHFKPRRIGNRMVVRPTWEDYQPEPELLEIVLDPGQAFGTGEHPTTRLCLELVEKASLQGKTIADVGCGSGILSIAAVKLGASRVVASDIDPQSVEVSRENAALNRVEFECSVADGFSALKGEQFDIVLSNIISATLIRMTPDAVAHVKPAGLWIVSGIIEGNWPDVLVAAERSGFKLVERLQEDEWVAATFLR